MSDTFDWGALVKDSEEAFAPLPPGTYDVVVHAAVAKTSSTGKPMFMITYKVTAGPETGKTTINNITVTVDNPKAMFFFFGNMAAMGISKQVFLSSPSPSNDQIAQMLVGNPCRIKTSLRMYQNQQRDNVDEILAPVSGSGVPSPPMPAAAPAAPVVAAPSPAPVAPAPPAAPVVAAAPAVAPAPVQEESTVVIPAPENPAVTVPEAAPAAATPPPPPF